MDEFATKLEQLNEREKQCLRLYHANFEVKEIAAELGLSPHTVTEHLRDVRRLLGVSRSIQAARLLIRFERDRSHVPTSNRVETVDDLEDPVSATPPNGRPSVARNRYNLGILTRIGLMIAIAFGAVALTGALLIGAEAITRVFVGHEIDISDPPY